MEGPGRVETHVDIAESVSAHEPPSWACRLQHFSEFHGDSAADTSVCTAASASGYKKNVAQILAPLGPTPLVEDAGAHLFHPSWYDVCHSTPHRNDHLK